MNNKISSSVIFADLKDAVSGDILFLKKLNSTDSEINELLIWKQEILDVIPKISESMDEVPTTSKLFKSYKTDSDLFLVDNHNLHVLTKNVECNGYPKKFAEILDTILKKYNDLVYQLKNKKMKGNFNAVKS